jgi:Carboxypeptidase regulatory-like domain
METRTKYFHLVGVAAFAFSIAVVNAQTEHSGEGSVSGTVQLSGPQPAAARINMAADPSCVKAHSGPVTTEEVVSGANGALKNVVVSISDGLGSRSFDPPKQPVVFAQKGCTYSPHILGMRTKQPLELVNNDPTSHNIHPSPQNNREWNIFQPASSSPIEETFARQEIVPVKCNVHPWMKGYIAVFNHPFFAITGEDGTFDLKDVPPGDYVIQAWHEKYGALTQKVTLGPGQTKTLDFVFKP